MPSESMRSRGRALSRSVFSARALAVVLAMATGVILGSSQPAAAATCSGFPWDPASPCLTLHPGSGPIGTHVTFSGHLPKDAALWRHLLTQQHSLLGLESQDVPGARCFFSGGVSDFHIQ